MIIIIGIPGARLSVKVAKFDLHNNKHKVWNNNLTAKNIFRLKIESS